MISVDKIFSRKFDVKCGLFMFILYSIISVSAYFYIWLACFIKSINNEIDEIVVTNRVTVISLALHIWGIICQYSLIDYMYSIRISFILSLVNFLLLVYISLKLRHAILKLFSNYSIQRNVNIILCILFPVIYHFYLISSVIKTVQKFNRLKK